jgi:hypothetical protein
LTLSRRLGCAKGGKYAESGDHASKNITNAGANFQRVAAVRTGNRN